MNRPSLSILLLNRKDRIIEQIDHLIRKKPLSQYQSCVLETEEGMNRLSTWCEKLIRTLDEGPLSFFEYQEKIGIQRADQGFQIDGASQFYGAFLRAVWEIYRDENAVGNGRMLWNQYFSDLEELQGICLQGLTVFSNTYLKRRESQIDEMISYLDQLHTYTHDIIGQQSLGGISALLLKNSADFFGARGCSLMINRDNSFEIFSHPSKRIPGTVLKLLKSVQNSGAPLFLDDKMRPCEEIDGNPIKLQLCLPIRSRTRGYGAFAMYGHTKGFRFTTKQLDILNQMLYITGVALENCLMIEEIERNRKELQALTGKMMTLEEEERKRIASDIHDTITQTLTGVCYQVQYCTKLIEGHPGELRVNLESVLQTVDRAIIQSRELISNLRPGLIDTVGLIPALHQLFDQFLRETGIEIKFDSPEDIEVTPDIAICLYRVLQSALSNIYKHADVKTALVKLAKRKAYAYLKIYDRGRGFDVACSWLSSKNPAKFGLIGMKERVEAAGGVFRIKSEVNKGTSIEIAIPEKGKKIHGKDQDHDRGRSGSGPRRIEETAGRV